MAHNLRYLHDLQGGGFGRIRVFYDDVARRKVVQKSLLHPTEDNCKRLIREGKLYQQLRKSPNIIDILSLDSNPTNPSLWLPFYELGTLQAHVGRTNWFDAIMMVQNCAGGLRDLHANGGIHRDVKPANIFLENTQLGRQVKLGDFGLGRVPFPFTRSDITRHACGTPGYIAPELYLDNAEFTQACDIYSLGVTGIQLITGSINPRSIETAWVNAAVKNLLRRMVSPDPRLRPSAKAIVNEARQIGEACEKNSNAIAAVALAGLTGLVLGKIFK